PALHIIAALTGVAQAGQTDETLGVRGAAGADAAGGVVQLDFDARFGNPVLHTGDPDDRFFLADARGDAEVGRLQQGDGRSPGALFDVAVGRVADPHRTQGGS